MCHMATTFKFPIPIEVPFRRQQNLIACRTAQHWGLRTDAFLGDLSLVIAK